MSRCICVGPMGKDWDADCPLHGRSIRQQRDEAHAKWAAAEHRAATAEAENKRLTTFLELVLTAQVLTPALEAKARTLLADTEEKLK